MIVTEVLRNYCHCAIGKAAGASASVPKRRRRQEGPGSSAAGGEAVNAANNKKGRRPKQEERVSISWEAAARTKLQCKIINYLTRISLNTNLPLPDSKLVSFSVEARAEVVDISTY